MELSFPNITPLRHEAAWDNREASIILDKRRIEGVYVRGFYPPHGGDSGNYPFTLHGTIHLIIHVRNTHIVLSSGIHFSSDIIYNVFAFVIYQLLNLWVPCVVYNSNSIKKKSKSHRTLNVLYSIISFKKVIACFY